MSACFQFRSRARGPARHPWRQDSSWSEPGRPARAPRHPPGRHRARAAATFRSHFGMCGQLPQNRDARRLCVLSLGHQPGLEGLVAGPIEAIQEDHVQLPGHRLEVIDGELSFLLPQPCVYVPDVDVDVFGVEVDPLPVGDDPWPVGRVHHLSEFAQRPAQRGLGVTMLIVDLSGRCGASRCQKRGDGLAGICADRPDGPGRLLFLAGSDLRVERSRNHPDRPGSHAVERASPAGSLARRGMLLGDARFRRGGVDRAHRRSWSRHDGCRSPVLTSLPGHDREATVFDGSDCGRHPSLLATMPIPSSEQYSAVAAPDRGWVCLNRVRENDVNHQRR
jgi:hypothetical protein